uniref:Uncharacterized protein n=1 Tax=Romanomermis culicivorax TaxID=13658 RepID=A0A915KP18_ROMCU
MRIGAIFMDHLLIPNIGI